MNSPAVALPDRAEVAHERGGILEIRTSTLGGGRVRVLLPAVSSPQLGT